jgi:hypothetical protein
MIVPLLCIGCAQETANPLASYAGASAVITGSLPQGYTEAASLEAAAETIQAARKTLAAKVLAAIALENVTGRKPDPARFAELD